MTPIVALGAGLALMASGPWADQAPGTLRPSTGTFGTYRAPSMGVPAPRYGLPDTSYRPPSYTSSTGSTSTLGDNSFTPYRGQSVYSNRGGINASPPAPKPRGYLSPYGAGGTSVYTNPYGR